MTLVTALALAASVAVNYALVHLATTFDPSLQHYAHFRFWDYGTLTALGVLCAGAVWFFVARNLAAARSTFFRIAVVTMLVLWLPDVWLFTKHEPTRAVTYLIVMHLAVGLITYNSLVFGAPTKQRRTPTPSSPRPRAVEQSSSTTRVPHRLWNVMVIAVALEFVSGLIGLVDVPFNRANGWLSHRGEATYLVHSLLGLLLGIAAVGLTFHVLRTREHRIDRIAAVSGLCGVIIGAIGGALCASHSLRLLGMGLMFVGIAVAFFGYLIPTIERARPVTIADD